MEKINERIKKKEEQIRNIQKRLETHNQQLENYKKQLEEKKISNLMKVLNKKGLNIEDVTELIANKNLNNQTNNHNVNCKKGR